MEARLQPTYMTRKFVLMCWYIRSLQQNEIFMFLVWCQLLCLLLQIVHECYDVAQEWLSNYFSRSAPLRTPLIHCNTWIVGKKNFFGRFQEILVGGWLETGYFIAVALFLGFCWQWTVSRLATQHGGTSNSCPRRSILAIDGWISATKVWPNHFYLVDNLEAFKLLLEGEYRQ
jgi:hypothetical protein